MIHNIVKTMCTIYGLRSTCLMYDIVNSMLREKGLGVRALADLLDVRQSRRHVAQDVRVVGVAYPMLRAYLHDRRLDVRVPDRVCVCARACVCVFQRGCVNSGE